MEQTEASPQSLFNTAATRPPAAVQAAAKAKPKRGEVSEMRKLTSQLDAEVKKSESSRVKIAKLQKGIEQSNSKIKAITAQISRQVS